MIAGCGQSDWQGVDIKGTVKVGGTPLANGSISFLPAPGRTGPSATGIIENGQFHILAADGPLQGPHKALVVLEVNPKKTVMGPTGFRPAPPPPGKTRWESVVEIPASPSFVCDLNLD